MSIELIISIIGGVAGIVATLSSTTTGAKITNSIKQKRAFARIQGFRKMSPGTKVAIEREDKGGGGDWLKEPRGNWEWVVVSITSQRIILRNPSTGIVTQMTPVEFEKAQAFVL